MNIILSYKFEKVGGYEYFLKKLAQILLQFNCRPVVHNCSASSIAFANELNLELVDGSGINDGDIIIEPLAALYNSYIKDERVKRFYIISNPERPRFNVEQKIPVIFSPLFPSLIKRALNKIFDYFKRQEKTQLLENIISEKRIISLFPSFKVEVLEKLGCLNAAEVRTTGIPFEKSFMEIRGASFEKQAEFTIVFLGRLKGWHCIYLNHLLDDLAKINKMIKLIIIGADGNSDIEAIKKLQRSKSANVAIDFKTQVPICELRNCLTSAKADLAMATGYSALETTSAGLATLTPVFNNTKIITYYWAGESELYPLGGLSSDECQMQSNIQSKLNELDAKPHLFVSGAHRLQSIYSFEKVSKDIATWLQLVRP